MPALGAEPLPPTPPHPTPTPPPPSPHPHGPPRELSISRRVGFKAGHPLGWGLAIWPSMHGVWCCMCVVWLCVVSPRAPCKLAASALASAKTYVGL